MFNKILGMPIPKHLSNEVYSNNFFNRDSFVPFVEKRSQHKHIFLRRNKQKTPIP